MITVSWKYQNYSFSFDIWRYVSADTEVLIKQYLVRLKYVWAEINFVFSKYGLKHHIIML